MFLGQTMLVLVPRQLTTGRNHRASQKVVPTLACGDEVPLVACWRRIDSKVSQSVSEEADGNMSQLGVRQKILDLTDWKW